MYRALLWRRALSNERDDAMPDVSLTGLSLVWGSAQGELLYTGVGLSFWGGVDPFVGAHQDQGRFATLRIDIKPLDTLDDAF
jgi:hypothetical protein